MKILISGGTGFIGTKLCSHLANQGHDIVVKTRQAKLANAGIKSVTSLTQIGADERFDVVINLAGEAIANKRWSPTQKEHILQSRLETTEDFIAFFKKAKSKPALFISGSAIGYYGIGTSNEAIDEGGARDDSFSSSLCAQWEAAALKAEALGIRTCLLRTGIVLGSNGGALQKMLLPFKLGLGGKIGSGKQWMSWIHLSDLIGIIDCCIDDKRLSGAVNGTAPYPVTNAIFTGTLGKTLRRPTVFSIPAVVIKLLMGQMGAELLLAGKKVLPSKVEDVGFKFKHERLESALSDILEK